MAFTRKFLSALGVEAEKIDEIITAHTEVTNALITERDGYKVKAEKYEDVTKERDDFKKKLEETPDVDKIQKEFEAYKSTVEGEKTTTMKVNALKDALKENGANEKIAKLLLKEFDLEKVEVEDGKIKDIEEIMKPISEQYSDLLTAQPTGSKMDVGGIVKNGNNGTQDDALLRKAMGIYEEKKE